MQHTAKTRYQHGDLEVIDCEECGYRHLWPMPTEADVRETYERKFGGSVRPQFRERKKEDADYWARVFARRLEKIDQLIPGQSGRRVLDVGCGVGDFLAFMRKNGWEAWGVEPSKAFHEDLQQRDINVIPAMVETVSASQWEDLGQFDVINMSQFLEHVRHPLQVLKSVYTALRPGGVLTVECPNDFNPLQLAAAESRDLPMWWISPLHINYFDFESLERLCQVAGFEPVDRTTQFPLEMFLHFGDVYVGNDDVGRAIHKKRVAFEESMERGGFNESLSAFYDALASRGFGRHATIYAVKR